MDLHKFGKTPLSVNLSTYRRHRYDDLGLNFRPRVQPRLLGFALGLARHQVGYRDFILRNRYQFAALNERNQLWQFLPGFLDANLHPLARQPFKIVPADKAFGYRDSIPRNRYQFAALNEPNQLWQFLSGFLDANLHPLTR